MEGGLKKRSLCSKRFLTDLGRKGLIMWKIKYEKNHNEFKILVQIVPERAGSNTYCSPSARVTESTRWAICFKTPAFTSKFCLTPSPVQLVKNPPAMQMTLVRSLGQEDPLEKEMATHSSTLAWRIPWKKRSLVG